jgi:hypothetical protein
VGEVACGDDEIELEPGREFAQCSLDIGVLPCADVQVRNVENPDGHGRLTL